jgi:hypothetical protein
VQDGQFVLAWVPIGEVLAHRRILPVAGGIAPE